MKAGDRLGFTWTDGAVVCYNPNGAKQGYCDKAIEPELGESVLLNQGPNGDREYAIRARYRAQGGWHDSYIKPLFVYFRSIMLFCALYKLRLLICESLLQE